MSMRELVGQYNLYLQSSRLIHILAGSRTRVTTFYKPIYSVVRDRAEKFLADLHEIKYRGQ